MDLPRAALVALLLALLLALLAPVGAQAAQGCTTVVFVTPYWESAAHGLPSMAGYTVQQIAGEADGIEIMYRGPGGVLLPFGVMGSTPAQLITDLAYVFRDNFGDAAFVYCPPPTSAPTSAPTVTAPTSAPTSAPTATTQAIPTPTVELRYRVAIPIAGWL